jgi:hypothetical protein
MGADPDEEEVGNLAEAADGADLFVMVQEFAAPDPDPVKWHADTIRRTKILRFTCRVFNIVFGLALIGILAWYTTTIGLRYVDDQAHPTTSVSFREATNVSFPQMTFCGYPGADITFKLGLQYFGQV